MRFSTIFTVLACGAMTMAAVIAPAALAKRDVEVEIVIGGLNDKCNEILPQFDGCRNAVCTASLVGQLVTEVEYATSECIGAVGELTEEVVELVAGVVTSISIKINEHKSSCNGQCGDVSVYAKVDVCLSALLSRLDICISGILVAVSKLLGSIVGILEGLGLTLILQVCSLL